MVKPFISVLDRPKIFCIGLEKTGTAPLARALQNIGYNVTGKNGPLLRPRIAQVYQHVCIRKSYKFEAFYGNPWPLMFREMYQLWPNAKFILTIRDPNEWIASMTQAFGGTSTPIRELIYGAGDPAGQENQYIRQMVKHENAVREFFLKDPGSLLVMDISESNDYQPLERFLGRTHHAKNFPNEGS